MTDHVRKLYNFYAKMLNISIPISNLKYAEIDIGGTKLAFCALSLHNELADEPAKAASNESVMIEVEVEDSDKEYERLKEMGVKFAKGLTTQPWGSRSFYFYDPDGNLVNFFTMKE